jgi:hypothetical protein
MREALNDESKYIYDRFVMDALRGGCDAAQAHSIAKQRYLASVQRQMDAVRSTRRETELPPR